MSQAAGIPGIQGARSFLSPLPFAASFRNNRLILAGRNRQKLYFIENCMTLAGPVEVM